MTLNLGMQQIFKYYRDFLNYDPGLNLTYFTLRSIWSLRLLYGKSEKYLYLLETIVALGLEIG